MLKIRSFIVPAALAGGLVLATAAAYAQPDAAPSLDAAAEPVPVAVDAGPPATNAEEKAPAQPPETASEALGVFMELVEAIRGGHWRMAAAFTLSLLMFCFNYARKNWTWLKDRLAGDRAGAISLIALALAGGFLTALFSDAPFDLTQVLGALWTAVEAAGIFVLLKKIIKPSE